MSLFLFICILLKHKSMTHLSVNINKIALIRNSRGTDKPNLVQVAKDCERFGAQGITIHPRPDERHAKYQDVFDLKEIVTTELNIEGNPNQRFMDVVMKAIPGVGNGPTKSTSTPMEHIPAARAFSII